MTVPYKITVGSLLSLKEKQQVESIIQQTFQMVDMTFNKWNTQSELTKLNNSKAHTSIEISEELAEFLNFVGKIVEITEGRFDPTIEPLQTLWKNKLEKGITPTNQEIDAIKPTIGWDKIHYDNGVFFKDHDLVSLDLGGIAKGLCVDKLVENLNAHGFINILVDWGGEIRASGEHPDGRPWAVYISRLDDSTPDHSLATLNLKNEAIATSGDYLQNWTIYSEEDISNAKVYFHIFNKYTHQPLKATYTSVASASVRAPSCALADGLATASMLFATIEEAQLWAHHVHQQLPEVSFWIVSRQTANERLISHD